MEPLDLEAVVLGLVSGFMLGSSITLFIFILAL